MHVDFHTIGITASPELRERAERRLRLAIGSAGGQIRQVAVRLTDERRGGTDKRCTIRVQLPEAEPVIIDQLESDLLVAIDRAADRAGRAVTRHLSRHLSAHPGRRSDTRGSGL